MSSTASLIGIRSSQSTKKVRHKFLQTTCHVGNRRMGADVYPQRRLPKWPMQTE